MGFEVEIASEEVAVPAGWEAVRLSTLPCSIELRRRLSRFPLRLEARGFLFDSHSYTKPEEAIALTDPETPAETVVIGNSRRAVMRLAATRLFWGSDRPPDYEVVSGDMSKQGRFRRGRSPLAIDRASDSDEIAAQATSSDSENGRARRRALAVPGVERAALENGGGVRRFRRPNAPTPLWVRLFPDAVTKARTTGSSRPADLSMSGREIVVDLDVSAPGQPDCVSPVLASAALAAEDKRLLARPVLLAAAGARACGRWWGRDVAGFAAFARRARVEPTPHEIVSGDESVSPVLAVGSAASWLEAGARAGGDDGPPRPRPADPNAADAFRVVCVGRARGPSRRPRSLPPVFSSAACLRDDQHRRRPYASPRSHGTGRSRTCRSTRSR
jgi:hypothetical protein